MEIVIIGADPPCPRCRETYERVKRAVLEIHPELSLKRMVCTSDEAQGLGKVGTAHDVAEWAGVQMDWNRVYELATGVWTQELDDLLMPLKEKADREHWIMTPVVVIDGEIAHSGSVPSVDDIKRMLKTRQPMSTMVGG